MSEPGAAACRHDADCGHVAFEEDGHLTWLVGEELRCDHAEHEHGRDSEGSSSSDSVLEEHVHANGHVHGDSCGHQRVKHGNHYDYLVEDAHNPNRVALHHSDGTSACSVHGYLKRALFPRHYFQVDGSGELMPHGECKKDAAHIHGQRRIDVDFVTEDTSLLRGSAEPWYKDRDTLRFVAMFFLTGGFFFVELIWGIVSGSLSLVADAMHMLSDVIGLVFGFYAMRVKDRGADDLSTFGWTRIEVVSGLSNAVFMVAVAFSILTESAQRFLESENDQLEKHVCLYSNYAVVHVSVCLCVHVFVCCVCV
ncbi:MAG: hypothetical protein MHM6MM_006468, partial [Cercozoa sp. M6MM]